MKKYKVWFRPHPMQTVTVYADSIADAENSAIHTYEQHNMEPIVESIERSDDD